jgi:molybdenum cofactor cytidylyltransferase
MISAIVLAAGLSSRMGRFKPLLPYGDCTVIEQVIRVLLKSAVGEIIVVVGFKHLALETLLKDYAVKICYNPDYATGEMLTSLQVGIKGVSANAQAILLALGDQPAIEQAIVEQVIEAHRNNHERIIIPSFQRRRGHPLVIPCRHWEDICSLRERETLRNYFKLFNDIFHVEVYTSSILRDMDTINDYHRELALMQDSSLVSQNS